MPVQLENAPEFVLFGTAHLLTLAVVAILGVTVAMAGRRWPHPGLPWALAGLLLAQELVKLQVYIGVLGGPWQENLPLAICRINEMLCMAMLVLRSYRAFEVAYFWSMAASVTAMVTPDLAQGFPGLLFVLFFLGHGLVVIAVIYAIFAWGFEPRPRSLAIALAVTAGYALLMVPVNLLLDANYLFLRHKPEAATVVDLLGPWPWYLLGLSALTVVLCALCYLPFAIVRRQRARRARSG